MQDLLKSLAPNAAELLAIPLRGQSRPQIDLSPDTAEGPYLSDHETLWRYVGQQFLTLHSPVLWGGYLEKRHIYAQSADFETENGPRDIHLGLDFWAKGGTMVFAPLAGTVHSFNDNQGHYNYGPTIVLRHEYAGEQFHSLYGHLSRESLIGLEIGTEVQQGEPIGFLGETEVNGNWPPHLHFQLIRDMQGWIGDYPGACSAADIAHFQSNCPNPNLLLGC